MRREDLYRAAKAIAAAAGACDGPYLFVELLWTSGPRAGEVWTVGNEPRLAGRDPVYSPSRQLRDPKFYTARTKRAVNSRGAL